MAARAAEAAHLPLLKSNSASDPAFDREALRRIAAAAPRARLRVDANGGWTFDQAREMLPDWLADHGVEFVEQPLARGQLDALAALHTAKARCRSTPTRTSRAPTPSPPCAAASTASTSS
jgi:L-alanine-DL-glutamate epimerase-like enolase superfamily enzyme